MASKKTTKVASTTTAPSSKADFIRTLPSSTPASEVVELAHAEGISVTPQYVYNLRARAKAPTATAAPKRGPGRPTGGGVQRVNARSAAPTGVTGVEELLRAAAAELGLSRAIEILSEQQAKVRSLLS